MPIVERDLEGFGIPSGASLKLGDTITLFELTTSSSAPFPDFTWSLSFLLPTAYRILLTGPDRPRPPHDNVTLQTKPPRNHTHRL